MAATWQEHVDAVLPPVSGEMLEALLNSKSYLDFNKNYKPEGIDYDYGKEVCIYPERTHFIHNWKTVDDYDGNHDCYVDPSLFSNFKDDDLCYLCSSPLSDGHVVRTACVCGAIIHTKCFDRLLKYGRKCVLEGDKLPSIVRTCGMCRQPLLGEDFDKQHKVTTVAYRYFFRLKVKFQKDRWPELLPVLISMVQIIKFVRKHWRSTTQINAIVGELLAKLGRGYIMIDSYQTRGAKYFKKYGWYACILALRLHNNSNSLGTAIVPYVCDVIVHHQTTARMLQFGRLFLPIVLNYLFQLINNTTHIYWTQVPEEQDKKSLNTSVHSEMQQSHVSAQQHILKILKGLESIDQPALDVQRTFLYLFLLHKAKLRPVKKEVEKEVEGEDMNIEMEDTETGEVKVDEYDGDVGDGYVILFIRPMFLYIVNHMHLVTYLTKKEKKKLWDAVQDNLNGASFFGLYDEEIDEVVRLYLENLAG